MHKSSNRHYCWSILRSPSSPAQRILPWPAASVSSVRPDDNNNTPDPSLTHLRTLPTHPQHGPLRRHRYKPQLDLPGRFLGLKLDSYHPRRLNLSRQAQILLPSCLETYYSWMTNQAKLHPNPTLFTPQHRTHPIRSRRTPSLDRQPPHSQEIHPPSRRRLFYPLNAAISTRARALCPEDATVVAMDYSLGPASRCPA